MSVIDRSALGASPLSDLHAIASELGLDGFRRLGRDDLIDAILARGGGEAASEETAATEPAGETPPPRRRGRSRLPRERDNRGEEPKDTEPETTAEGTIELLANGSGFVRVSPPDPSDDDVYVSAAQVRRCELVSGDRVSGPVRPPRRSERFPSLVRVETINGSPADEVAAGTRYDDLRVTFATERFALGSEDPTLKAIEFLTPFGRGSRVALVGPSRAGKSEALRRFAGALAAVDGVEVFVVLSGTRPEELAEWGQAEITPAAASALGASPEARDQTIDSVVEQGRRIAARGGDAVVLIDSLEGLPATAARRALGAARNLVESGSLTVIAAAPAPVGGETTVIAFDLELASGRRYPAIDLSVSGTMRPELLVGEAGADAIARARSEAV